MPRVARRKAQPLGDSEMTVNQAEDFNPLDPEFLLSEQIDRALCETEQRALEDAVAASSNLRRAARDYQRLRGVLSAWTRRCPAVDADAFQRRVREAMRDEPDAPNIDADLARWAGSAPRPSADDFVAAVRAKISDSHPARDGSDNPRSRLVRRLRLGAPLAAAAAIVLAFSLWALDRDRSTGERVSSSTGSSQADPTGETPVERPGVSFALDRSRGTRVAFDRTAVVLPEDEEISFIAFGVTDRDDESYLEG